MSKSYAVLALALTPILGAQSLPKDQPQKCEAQSDPRTIVGNAKTVGADTLPCLKPSEDPNIVGNSKTVGADRVTVPSDDPEAEMIGNSKTVGGR